MHFMNPAALLLLPLLAGLWWRSQRAGQSRQAALAFSDLNLVRIPGALRPAWERHIPLALTALALVLLVVAMARPQMGIARQVTTSKGIDIMLCIDTSGSMQARDLVPDREAAATSVSQEFVQDRPGDRIGLVVFSGQALTQCPLTSDHGSLLTALKATKVGMTHTEGTAVGSAIATCINRLKDVPGSSKVVVLLTDGSNNAGEIEPARAAEMAAKYGIKIYTIGMGTDGPAAMPEADPLGGERTVMVRGDLDEPSLRQIAAATGGTYFRAGDNGDLEGIYREINRLEKRSAPSTEVVNYRELYAWFLWPAMLLLGCDVLLKNSLLKELV